MAIVYVETNFLLSIATGQDAEAADLLANTPPNARLIVPSGCFMEALSALEGKRRNRNKLEQLLKQEIQELKRDRKSLYAERLRSHLEQARAENTSLLYAIDTMLSDAMRRLAESAERIELTAAILDQSLSSGLFRSAPTDGLIFTSILEHARIQISETKAFLSANTKDFGSEDVRKALRDAGIEYFAEAKNVLGWLKSLSSS